MPTRISSLAFTTLVLCLITGTVVNQAQITPFRDVQSDSTPLPVRDVNPETDRPFLPSFTKGSCEEELCGHFTSFSPDFAECLRTCLNKRTENLDDTSGSSLSYIIRRKSSSSRPRPSSIPSSRSSRITFASSAQSHLLQKEVTKFCVSPQQKRVFLRNFCDDPINQGYYFFPPLTRVPDTSIESLISRRFTQTNQSRPIEDIISEAIDRLTKAELRERDESVIALTLREIIQSIRSIPEIHGPSGAWDRILTRSVINDIARQLGLANQVMRPNAVAYKDTSDVLRTVSVIFQRLPAFLKTVTESGTFSGVSAQRAYTDYGTAREAFLEVRHHCVDESSQGCVVSLGKTLSILKDMRAWMRPTLIQDTQTHANVQVLFEDLNAQWAPKPQPTSTQNGPFIIIPDKPFLE
jgi:hypothetical protein